MTVMENHTTVAIRVRFSFLFKGVPVAEMDCKDLSIDCEAFRFMVKHPTTGANVEIPFDFDAFGVSFNNTGVLYESGMGFIFNTFQISDDFNEEYKKYGLDVNDISAQLLASTSKIAEIGFIISKGPEEFSFQSDEINGFEIKEIVLTDLVNKYPVATEVINEFNKTLVKKGRTDVGRGTE